MFNIKSPAQMAALLRETEHHHAAAQQRLPKHEWQDWYGTYMSARLTAFTPEAAIIHADNRIGELRRGRFPCAEGLECS